MMKIFFFHWLILNLRLMIVVLDIMLFGYDGMKRLVHAGECFKAFALTGSTSWQTCSMRLNPTVLAVPHSVFGSA